MTDPAPRVEERRSSAMKWIVAGVLLVGLGAGVVLLRSHVGTSREEVEAWVRALGPWGPVAFVGACVLLTSVASPMWPLTVLSGVLFGPFVGVALSSLASTIAATGAMLCSRYLARDLVERKLGRSAHFVRLNVLIEQHGAAVVAFTRLVPLFPFSLLNLAFGLTPVRATTYIFWSWLCMLPTTLIYVIGGSAVKEAMSGGRVPWPAITVAVAVAVGVFFVGRAMRRRMSSGATNASPDG